MPACNASCPSTGCYLKILGDILTYQCVECELTSTVNLATLPQAVMKALLGDMKDVLDSLPSA